MARCQIKCPRCGCMASDVANTRDRADGSVRRTRTCRECGYSFRTRERVVLNRDTINRAPKSDGTIICEWQKGEPMAEIYHIEDLDEHTVSELICVKCGKRFIDVRPSSCLLKNLECPECGRAGYLIETGQELFDEDGEYIKG